MDPVLANLLLARERLAAKIADEMQNLMPDYDLDDQQFEWGSYMAGLMKNLEDLDKAIQRRKPVGFHWVGTPRPTEVLE
jgi:hypothetical protein